MRCIWMDAVSLWDRL